MAEAIVFMSDNCLCLLLIWEGWEAKIPYNFWAKVRNFGYSPAGGSKGLKFADEQDFQLGSLLLFVLVDTHLLYLRH